MKINALFLLNPEKNTNKYTDYINYIDTSSVTEGKLENIQYLESEFPSRANRLVQKKDILYSSVRPNLKHFYFYNDDYSHCVASTGFVILRKKESVEVDEKFIYYYLSTNTLCRHFSNIAELSQTTFPSISAKDIAKIDIPNFSQDEQNKIANILSRYDEAIENNNKRTKLLEQMAQNLYKEWFVRFRFPGWQNAEFENGIPKDWHQGKLSELLEFKRGKNITSDEMIEGDIPVISAGLEPSGYHNAANVTGVSLTISSSGANAGYLSIHYENIWAADCNFISEKKTKNIFYIYELLNNIRPVITNQQRGAAQPHVYCADVNRLRLYIPDEDLMNKANNILEKFHKEINQLQKANINLAKQRDLLLPRLMSGKLEVK